MPKNLSYPLDVEGDDHQGHYIMFMINESTSGKIGKGKRASNVTTDDDTGLTGFQGKKFIDTNLNSGAGIAQQATFKGAVAGSLHFTRPPTTRMSQAITLYMPPSVKVSYKSNYKDSEIGFLASGLAAAGGGAIEAFSSGGGDMMDKLTAGASAGGKALGEGTAAFLADKAMKIADTFAPGAATLAQLSAGAILGSKMEVMFTDVGRRNFSFTFNFIPKSEQEARMVYDIVQTFKEHMLPEYMTAFTTVRGVGHPDHGGTETSSISLGQGRVLKIPNTFDIFYFFHNNENPFLNRISTCYLTSMDIDYGGEKYVTYEPIELNGQVGPPPQKTSISLAFTEIETITRERAKQGF